MLQPFNRIFGLKDKSDSEAEEVSYQPDEVIKLPVQNIRPNRFQPRTLFNEEKN